MASWLTLWAWRGKEIPPGATSVSVAPSAMLPAGLPSWRKRMLCRPLIISRTSTSSVLRTFACRIAQLERAQPGVEHAVAVAVAPGRALAAALIAPGANQPLDIRFHQQLQH